MSKQLNNIKFSVADIIQLFKTAPEQAYEQLISSSHYFHTKQTKSFWDAYIQLDHDKLRKQFPDSVETFNQVVWLCLFNDLNEVYKNERTKDIKELVTLNPDETSLTKSLFLCLELGETSTQPSNFPNYSEESLEAIKILLKEVLPLLTGENKTSYSLELAQLSNNLIKIQIDIALLSEFLDAFAWADFEMMIKESSKGFVLSLPDGKPKTENLFILNHLKTIVKRDFKRKESHPKISEEEHFKKNDPKWKTQEGLAGIFHGSGVTVNALTPGLTSLQIDDAIMKNITSQDSNKRNRAILQMERERQEQNFHSQFRNALSQIYQPNDEIDIKTLYVEVEKDILLTIYELLCAMSCIIASADAFRYMSDCPNRGSIKSIKAGIWGLICSQNPQLSLQEKESVTNSEIIHHFKMFDKHYNQKIFYFLKEENILDWFSKIEELKTKSQKELKAIINLFSKFDSPLPFNPIYKIDKQYYFSYTTCGKFNLNRLVYDNYVSEKLFSQKFKSPSQKKESSERSNSRAESFAVSIAELFKKITPFSEASIYYGGGKNNWEFGDLEGDIDTLVYFEKENILMPIQIKLSNVSPTSEKRKMEWLNTRIEQEGINQVGKDLKLLQIKSGLKFVAEKLKTENEIKAPLIYPLIITDNFFADHLSFSYNENNDCVTCVSYFELKHVLLNQKIHDKQADWLPFENINAASRLIEMIETNSFWNFLDEFADNFSLSKTLSEIDDELKIEMKV